MNHKYRKKPVVIEAVQVNLKNLSEDKFQVPDWLTIALNNNDILLDNDGIPCLIKTLEGGMRVRFNDWIIRGVNGELYPCKPDIFEKTYVKVEIDELTYDLQFCDRLIQGWPWKNFLTGADLDQLNNIMDKKLAERDNTYKYRIIQIMRISDWGKDIEEK